MYLLPILVPCPLPEHTQRHTRAAERGRGLSGAPATAERAGSSSHCIGGKVKKPRHFLHILFPIFVYSLKQKQLSNLSGLLLTGLWRVITTHPAAEKKTSRLTVSKTPSGKFQSESEATRLS